jgi:hypothetical protein
LCDIITADPDEHRAAAGLRAYFTEIAPGFGPDFDPAKPRPVTGYRPPHGRFLLAGDVRKDGLQRGRAIHPGAVRAVLVLKVVLMRSVTGRQLGWLGTTVAWVGSGPPTTIT